MAKSTTGRSAPGQEVGLLKALSQESGSVSSYVSSAAAGAGGSLPALPAVPQTCAGLHVGAARAPAAQHCPPCPTVTGHSTSQLEVAATSSSELTSLIALKISSGVLASTMSRHIRSTHVRCEPSNCSGSCSSSPLSSAAQL